MEAKKYKEASDLYTEVLRTDPLNFAALFGRASSRASQEIQTTSCRLIHLL